MQQATESTPSPTAGSFAGLLASLTAPKPSTTAWNDDGLADDAVTLSYENALRTHARYRAPDPMDRSLTQSSGTGLDRIESYELAAAEEVSAAHPAGHFAASEPSMPAEPDPAVRARMLIERNLKSASITIRLSREESAQLHRRAADAGLTVSAYLRSCTFEAESLRALVKDTMAQLRAANAAGKQAAQAPARRSFGARLSRLFTPWRADRSLARA
jgi:hypothetical protein